MKITIKSHNDKDQDHPNKTSNMYQTSWQSLLRKPQGVIKQTLKPFLLFWSCFLLQPRQVVSHSGHFLIFFYLCCSLCPCSPGHQNRMFLPFSVFEHTVLHVCSSAQHPPRCVYPMCFFRVHSKSFIWISSRRYINAVKPIYFDLSNPILVTK